VVWEEGEQVPLADYNGEHGLDQIPVAVTFADGSELFEEEERKRDPFMFAYLTSQLWQRETLALSSIFTSLYERGTGPLIGIEPASLGQDNKIDINWAGTVRYIIGKVQLLNDKAFDPDLMQALDLLNGMIGDSLLYRQALGQPLGGGGIAFSTVALLNQAGRLPLVSPSEAVGDAIGQIASIAIRRLKKENLAKDFLSGDKIPERFSLTARLDIKLPQDDLRNAQIADTLTKGDNPVTSVEWVRQNVLGITDSNQMDTQIFGERYLALRFAAFAQQMIQSMIQPARPPAAPSRTMSPPGNSPQAAAAGAGQLPLVEPLPPAQEQTPKEQIGE